MRRNSKKKLKALLAVPELSSESTEEQVSPNGVLALSFLAGFAEVASSSDDYKKLQIKIFHERLKMEIPRAYRIF